MEDELLKIFPNINIEGNVESREGGDDAWVIHYKDIHGDIQKIWDDTTSEGDLEVEVEEDDDGSPQLNETEPPTNPREKRQTRPPA